MNTTTIPSRYGEPYIGEDPPVSWLKRHKHRWAVRLAFGAAALALAGAANATPITFAYTGSIDSFTIPVAGLYDIVAFGAEGGSGDTYISMGSSDGGLGARAGGTFNLLQGEILSILVGGMGTSDANNGGGGGGGGGGGSFVIGPGDTPLVIAGGGGGGGLYSFGGDGSSQNSGTGGNPGGGGINGLGGTNGDGGGGGRSFVASGGLGGSGGGGGFSGDGANGGGQGGGGGKSFANGGAGGNSGPAANSGNGGAGGFGGGGGGSAGGGGGGGYSGGGGSFGAGGGGGGSFVDAATTLPALFASGVNSGNGYVTLNLRPAVNAVSEPGTLGLFGLGLLGLTLVVRKKAQKR